jgi:CRP/FNR family cyclic AMP-dependent transcriptional regulator
MSGQHDPPDAAGRRPLVRASGRRDDAEASQPEAGGGVLGRDGLFGALDGAAREVLSASAARKSWSKGTLIFQRGDEGDFLVAVTAGRIRLSVAAADGRELVLRHAGAGEVIGEFSLIDGQPRSTDATAAEPTEGHVLYRRDFVKAVAARPELGMALARHLCGLLRSTNYQMESIALYDLRMRVVRFMLLTLREVHGEAVPTVAQISLRFSQAELAAVLGASRPKLNQVMQALVAEGAIRRDGERLSCDYTKLLQAVEAHTSR